MLYKHNSFLSCNFIPLFVCFYIHMYIYLTSKKCFPLNNYASMGNCTFKFNSYPSQELLVGLDTYLHASPFR